MNKNTHQKQAGRPPQNIVEPIKDTPENVARAIMAGSKKQNKLIQQSSS